MKKIYAKVLLMAAVAVFTACSGEEDNIFDKSAAERLNEVSGVYSQRLADSKGGWVMEYYPYSDNENLVTGVGYLIMTRFHENGSVYTVMKNAATDEYRPIAQDKDGNIWSKVNTTPILISDSSSWQVITDMGPVLSFNTYNKCLGVFSDPTDIPATTSKYDDEKGKGYRGDYEFVMVDVPQGGDHILLKGKRNADSITG